MSPSQRQMRKLWPPRRFKSPSVPRVTACRTLAPPKKIGAGNFSTVYRSVHTATGTPVVLKTLKKSNSPLKGGFVAREQWCLENLEHPNIIRTPPLLARQMGLEVGSFKMEDGSVVMIQEEANGGDLFDHVEQCGYVEEAQAKGLFAQLLSAMEYLHDAGVAHLDIKIENVLLHRSDPSSDFELKLADFGLCRLANEFGDNIDAVVDRNGTMEFMSPEMHLSRRSFGGKQADMWAVGICLFILLTGFPPMTVAKTSCPWFSLINRKRYTLFWKKVDQVLKDNGRPIPSQKAKDLINKLLDVDPSSRMSAKGALEHPFSLVPTNVATTLILVETIERVCTKAATQRWFDNYRQEKQQEMAAYAAGCTAASHVVLKREKAAACCRWKHFTKRSGSKIKKTALNEIRVRVFSGSLSTIIFKSNLRHAMSSWKNAGEPRGIEQEHFVYNILSTVQRLCICCALLRWSAT